MTDVFISYKHEDQSKAETIFKSLVKEGFSVWWDEQISPRTAWDASIEAAISEAASVLVLWSPRSIDSDWVRAEAHYGHDRRKLVPALIDRCELPLAFRLTQTVDLCGWNGDALDRNWRKLLIWLADLKTGRELAGAVGVPPVNPFRDRIGQIATGEAIVSGDFVNDATPAGTLFQDYIEGPVMRVLPRGNFMIGGANIDPDRAENELPQRRIHIDHAIAVGIFPVTTAQFEYFRPPSPPSEMAPLKRGWLARKPPPPPPMPRRSESNAAANCLSWRDATAYCRGLSAATGSVYRLPSEAEWEYACRAQSRARFSWGDMIDPSLACYALSSVHGPRPPGRYPPNGFGLWDMHGNVREWTADLWRDNYESTPLDGTPAVEGHSSMRVTRGGAWSDPAPMLRSSARSRATEAFSSEMIGFRVVRELATTRVS